MTRAILLLAHLALVPCGGSTSDARAVHEAIHVVRQARKIRSGPPQAVLVPNKVRVRHRPPRELSDTLKSVGIPTMTRLRLDRAFADAAAQQTLVWRLGACGKRAAKEITDLTRALDLHGAQGAS